MYLRSGYQAPLHTTCKAHELSVLCAAEPEYAERLIKHAKQMLEFGLAHPGSYMTSKQEGLKDHSKHYPSSNYNDEMAWGALWLHLATEVSLPLYGTPVDSAC